MISHLHKVIFIHIPKCAGRSISHALQQPFDHYTALHYQTHHPAEWNEYTVFTTVRNPYQRMVSMYHYIRNEPFHANHPITRFGNMLPFKEWMLTNISAFHDEFDMISAEGERQTDSETGSPFWFSSQSRRVSDAQQSVYNKVHIFRYENGMSAIRSFLQTQLGIALEIPHLNRSHNDTHYNYLDHYDKELLTAVNAFPPFAKDCISLGYKMIQDKVAKEEANKMIRV